MKKKLIYSLLFLFSTASVVLAVYLSFNKPEPEVKSLQSINLLTKPVSIYGNKSLATYEETIPDISLINKNAFQLTLDLYGLCLLKGDAGSISIDQGTTKSGIIIADYVKNCHDGLQTLTLPFAEIPGFDFSKPIKKIFISVWYPADFRIDIKQIIAISLDEDVLGRQLYPSVPEGKNTFENIPLRPFPYARQSMD
ncbi:MAG: hypothetical protein UV73_C0010G0002 [Candidatus Gottesmanbacteria bacterium GW2011_GWA2_43_14]|uniref:Uncharacterized protein n=1 Tax=Candidatus Gottesmanbacteria bacterium GW2011_GWA2_43_14 TaxID=1618443 RepID=A0A0G1DFN1_9BACT|nr:MAG: hypothetical protein UV73_C0010G0002 [Candidatus Gottesmanbacteria bacterium GW2011_GWA2_43_14]